MRTDSSGNAMDGPDETLPAVVTSIPPRNGQTRSKSVADFAALKNEIRGKIFNSEDIKTELVVIPEWGDVEIEVRGMKARQRNHVLNCAIKRDDEGKVTVNMVAAYPELVIETCFIPGSGKPGIKVFDAADRDGLNERAGDIVDRLATVASRLSGLSDKAVTDAKKNSATSPSSDSISDSQSSLDEALPSSTTALTPTN